MTDARGDHDSLPPQPSDAAPLRPGWTTGTCATAAAASAYGALLTGGFADPVEVRLPRGGTATLSLARAELTAGEAIASVIKDAGDDPDVTHGAEIVVSVRLGRPGEGVTFRAGLGVGVVTLPGLPLAPGEPAINPGPRAMIRAALAAIAAANGLDEPAATVTISVPGGEALARKTLNGRLGVAGGLSILGTTGIVTPFSCAAWIHSIHRGIDVARAAGLARVVAATGSVSEQAAQRLYDLPETALIDMGDFAGGTLKYLRAHPVPRLTLAGGFGKLAKLAQGRLFLHSRKSRLDLADLSGWLAESGAPPETVARAAAAGSGAAALVIAGPFAPALAARVAREARSVARAILAPTAIDVETLIFDRAGALIARAQETPSPE